MFSQGLKVCIEVSIMPLVGRFLGPVLGPRKKMPKPVPATAKAEPIMEKLKSTAKVRIKDQPVIQALVGAQDMWSAQGILV